MQNLELPSKSSLPSLGVAALRPDDADASFFYTERGTLAFTKTCLALFLAGFATFSLLYCVQPLLPVFALQFRVGAGESSLALSLTTAVLAFAILSSAALSEILGRTGLMYWSMVLAAALTIAVPFAPSWFALLWMRAAVGFALGGVPAVAMAYLAEEIRPQELGRVMGLYIAGTAFGGMAGRVAVSLIAAQFSWRIAMIVTGAIGICAAVGFITLIPRSKNFTPSLPAIRFHFKAWSGHLRDKSLLRLYCVAFLVMGTFVAVYNFIGFRLIGAPFYLDQRRLSYIFIIYLFGVAASYGAGLLSDRFGRRLMMRVSVLITAAGVLLTLSSEMNLIILGIIGVTIGFFATHAVASSTVGQLSGKTKGHGSSLYLLAYYLGSSSIGSAAGYLFQVFDWRAVVILGVLLLALALLAVPRLSNPGRGIAVLPTA